MASFLNPCLCPGQTSSPNPTLSCGEECICLCDILIAGEDKPDLCDEGSINLEEGGHTLTACGESTHYWELHEYNQSFFVSISLTLAGVLTFRTDTPGLSIVTVKFTCGDYSGYTTVTVGGVNPCVGVVCPQGQVCNKCTGGCIDTPEPNVSFVEVC
jgi:hypothetical protein